MAIFEGYHGSTDRITRFSAAKRRRSEYGDGFYFTDDYETAERFGPIVGSYAITLRKPLHAGQFELGRMLAEMSGTVKPGMRHEGAWITRTARRLGYDGIVLQMVTGQRYIVAFSPSQIRHQKPGPAPTIPTSTTLKVQARIKGWEPAF
jgi:hypothetical protein